MLQDSIELINAMQLNNAMITHNNLHSEFYGRLMRISSIKQITRE